MGGGEGKGYIGMKWMRGGVEERGSRGVPDENTHTPPP